MGKIKHMDRTPRLCVESCLCTVQIVPYYFMGICFLAVLNNSLYSRNKFFIR